LESLTQPTEDGEDVQSLVNATSRKQSLAPTTECEQNLTTPNECNAEPRQPFWTNAQAEFRSSGHFPVA